MQLNRTKIQRMVDAVGGTGVVGGSSGDGMSIGQADSLYVSQAYFNQAFSVAYKTVVTVTDGTTGEETTSTTISFAQPNTIVEVGTTTTTDPTTGDVTTTTVSLLGPKVLGNLLIGDSMLEWDATNSALRVINKDGKTAASFYATGGVSALGYSPGGGGGGGATTLAGLFDVQLTNPTNGQALVYNSVLGKWVNGTGGGSVTSVGLSAPTGFEVSGSPVTGSGTLTLRFATGYSLPTTSQQEQWNTAYGWGNHATAGYATQTWVQNQNYATQSWVQGRGYITASALNGYATQSWVQSQGYLTASSFSAFSAVDEKLSITIGSTTRAVQAPTIADLGVNAESASSSSTPSAKFPGVKLGTKTGLYMTRLYDTATPPSATPVPYGNIINIIGGGGGQILAQWHGSYDTGHLFYRSHRDTTSSGGWTPWKKVAFTDDTVASADKLTTARTLWGQSFNGTANVTGNMTSVGSIAATGEIKTSNGNAFRLSYGNVGTILRSDSTSFHVLFTDSGSADAGTWNSLRPLSINKTSGIVRMENGLYIYNANQPNANNDGFNALRIGNAVLSWDSTNNALKVSKYDGTAVNFYSLGGVSALGFQAGSSNTSITNLTVTDTLTASNVNVGSSDFSIAPYTYNSTTGLAITSVRRVKIEGDNVWLNSAYVDSNSFFHSPRFYFDATHYLRYSDNHLQFYNGSSFINLT